MDEKVTSLYGPPQRPPDNTGREVDPMSPRSIFAACLTLTRRRRGFTSPQALAEAAGLQPARLCDLETAGAEPTIEELVALRSTLGVTLDFLIAFVGMPTAEGER